MRETFGLDVGFVWPNGSARKEVENDTDLELRAREAVGRHTPEGACSPPYRRHGAGRAGWPGGRTAVQASAQEAQASEVRRSLGKVGAEGRGLGTGVLSRGQQSCAGSCESEWQNREVAFGSTEVTRGPGCGWGVGRRVDPTVEEGVTLVAEVRRAMSLTRGRLIKVRPACPSLVVCPQILLSHVIPCYWLFKFLVVLFSDHLLVSLIMF